MSTLLDGARFEIRALKKSPATILILAGAALFYSLIYPAPYSPQIYRDMPIYALDMDDSPLSRQLLAKIDASEKLDIVNGSGNRFAAIASLKRDEVLGYVEIPVGFQREVTRGNSPPVGLFSNAGYLLAYSQLTNSASTAILTTGGEIGAGLAAEHFGNTFTAKATQAPFGLYTKELFDPAGGYASFVVPAVAMIILQQTMLIGLGLLCDARREMDIRCPQGISTGIVWTLGRNIPWVILYLCQFLIIRWAIFPIYHLPAVGSNLELLPFMGLFLLAVSLFGLLIAEIFRHSDDVIPFLLFTSLPIVFLSGFSWPLQNIPDNIRWIAYLIPSTPGVEGFVQLNQLGSSLTDILGPIFNLTGLVIIYSALLYLFMRKKWSR